MKHYPVQIEAIIKDEDISIIDKYSDIIFDFIKSINYKVQGEGKVYIFQDCLEIKYRFSYINAVKFMKLLQDLGYNFEIRFFVKVVNEIPIYE
ncbi:MAG: hypothetical protein ACO3UU_16265 [Minisyncoccia bacterium]